MYQGTVLIMYISASQKFQPLIVQSTISDDFIENKNWI